MRLALQIFRKDVERLWWAILPTLALLALFAVRDITPPTYQSSNALNLILPLAWTLLVALVIQQDSLTGDRQWAALPAGWKPFAIAKAAFIAIFIHGAYFVAAAAILIARGFNPLQSLPHLLWKQLAVLALVLPAIAVASVVKNFAQFMLVPLTVAAVFIFLSNRINRNFQYDEPWDMRWQIAIVVLVVGALAVVALQFASRQTMLSRAIGIATVIVAGGLYSVISRDASAAIHAALQPAPSGQSVISVGLSNRDPYWRRGWNYNSRQTNIELPIAYSGLPPNGVTRLSQISLELIRPNGERDAVVWPRSNDERRRLTLTSDIEPQTWDGYTWLYLQFLNPALWNSVRSGPVTIHGKLLAEFYQPGALTTLENGAGTWVPGIGYCRTLADPVNVRFPISTLECESANLAPREIRTARVMPGRPKEDPRAMERGYLRERNFFTDSKYPQDPWLSPLLRGTSLMSRPNYATTWYVRPLTAAGVTILDFTIPNIDLNAHVAGQRARTGAPR